MERYDLRLGDSRDVLKTLADNSIDSVCCDPPYALDTIVKRFGGENAAPPRAKEGTDGAFARASAGFMNQAWDTGETAFSPAFWAEVYRVLKPGGYLVAFGGTRTYHRLACAIEDAGFMIEDMIAWLYGSGFPKSHKPSIYLERLLCLRFVQDDGSIVWRYADGEDQRVEPPFRHPQANAWWGYGTALKPGLEPICFAQKPLIGTIAENVLAWQVGVLNIDATRIALEAGDVNASVARRQGATSHLSERPAAEAEAAGVWESRQSEEAYRRPRAGEDSGRWPANVVHDNSPEVLAAFPQASGMKAPVGPETGGDRQVTAYNPMGPRTDHAPRGDTGSAARFFYGSKASTADREEGCGALDDAVLARSSQAQAQRGVIVEADSNAFNSARSRKNNHPTVKPTDLMQWLCRLVTPAGGVILDPFMGSGSTGKAAMLEGFRFVGIEREAPFFAIAEARVARGATARDVNPPQASLFGD
jgi:site-specific DNA-methyltransferase (adenine-specific)